MSGNKCSRGWPALEKQTELVNIITDIVATIKTKLNSRQDRYGDQIDTSTDLSADSVDRYLTEGYRDTQITQDPNFINESGKVLLVIKEPW